MEALAVALQAEQEEEVGDTGKKKVDDDHCKEHSMPYDFWVNDTWNFYCRKCVVEKCHVKLKLVEDGIHEVKAVLADHVKRGKMYIEKHLESLDENQSNLVKKKIILKDFMKTVKALDDDFDQEIEHLEALRAKALDSSVEMEEVEGKINSIKSPADLGVMMECRSTLNKVDTASIVLFMDFPQELLSAFACCYMEEITAASPSSRASFISRLESNAFGQLTGASSSLSGASTSRPIARATTPIRFVKIPNNIKEDKVNNWGSSNDDEKPLSPTSLIASSAGFSRRSEEEG